MFIGVQHSNQYVQKLFLLLLSTRLISYLCVAFPHQRGHTVALETLHSFTLAIIVWFEG